MENDTRVRVDGLSNMIATACGPVEGPMQVAVLPEREGELEDLALLGRGEVVIPQEVARHHASLVSAAWAAR